MNTSNTIQWTHCTWRWMYGVGVSIRNTCRVLINNMGLHRPHHSTETIQLYVFICTWGICCVKILRACTVYLSWVLGHTHAHNSMRSTLYRALRRHMFMYARSIALLFVICFFVKYCFFNIAFSLLLFRYCFFCGAKVRKSICWRIGAGHGYLLFPVSVRVCVFYCGLKI